MQEVTYATIFSLMFLENIIIPIPSEAILLYVGYLASTNQIDLFVSLFIATMASVTSSLLVFFVTSKLRRGKVVSLLRKFRVKEDDLKKADRFFRKYGELAVFLARLMPGLRSIISYPAGFFRMSTIKFLVYTLAGTLLWNSLLIYAGYYLGNNWELALEIMDRLKHPSIIVALIIFALLYKKLLSKDKK